MDKKFIMTVFGKDRPGIVADIAEVIFENLCNLEESLDTLGSELHVDISIS